MLDDPRIAHWFSDNWHHPLHQPSTTRYGAGAASLNWFLNEPEDIFGSSTLNASFSPLQGQWHPKLTLLPIGINDRHVPGSHGDRKILLKAARSVRPNSFREPRARATFHHSQKLGWWSNPASGSCCDRHEALSSLSRPSDAASDTVEAEIPPSGDWGVNVTSSDRSDHCVQFDDFPVPPGVNWARHSDLAFEVAPQGNGIDTHRVWEALILQTIPIVTSSSLAPLYASFPVLILDSWSELEEQGAMDRLARWHRVLSPRFENHEGGLLRQVLSVEHWVNLVREKQLQLRSGMQTSGHHDPNGKGS